MHGSTTTAVVIGGGGGQNLRVQLGPTLSLWQPVFLNDPEILSFHLRMSVPTSSVGGGGVLRILIEGVP